jgi:hypothetical protein
MSLKPSPFMSAIWLSSAKVELVIAKVRREEVWSVKLPAPSLISSLSSTVVS